MKVCVIEKSPINIQKLQVTKDCYDKLNSSSTVFCNISPGYKILARLFLHEDVCVADTMFIDRTVILPKEGWQHADDDEVLPSLCEITEIRPIKTVKDAETINVIIVFNRPMEQTGELIALTKRLVQNFLRQIVIAEGAVVICSSVPEMNIHAIIVTKIGGKSCEAARVTTRTQIHLQDSLSVEKYNSIRSRAKSKSEDALFINPSGMVELFDTISSVVRDTFRNPSEKSQFKPENKLLLVGPSGCGKTSLVSALARHCERILLKLECGDHSSTSFNAALSATINKANSHAAVGESCSLLLKNIDGLCRSKNDKSKKISAFVKQLASEIDGIEDDISIIATTDSPELMNPILRKFGCFHQEIEFPMLTEDERWVVFKHLARVYNIDCSDESARNVARWTPGFLLSDLVSVLREALSCSNYTAALTDEILRKAVSNTSPSLLRGTRGWITSKKTTFDDLGGLEPVKRELRMSILWQMNNPEAFLRLGIPPTKGILLHGPPGCAKTTLVKALANESSATFLAVSSADLYSPYVGESEKRVVKLFAQARIGAPSIVFIDEIDALVGSKGGSRESGVQERILATLLMEMDGIGVNIRTSDALMKAGQEQAGDGKNASKSVDNSRVVVVGATNRPELLDDALKRPGRFDKLIHIPLPDTSERLAILRCITAKMPLDDSVNLSEIAELTVDFSGADLKAICSEAALFAMTVRGVDVPEIVQSDLMNILKTARTSVEHR